MRLKFLVFMVFPLAILSAQGKTGKIEFIEYDLPNGLHVILHEDHSAPIVAVNIWYHVGSKNEDTNRTGFAHLFEHMMFQGSANVKKAEHMAYIQKAGGTFNASTSWDRTNYFQVVPSHQLELVLWLESDRMTSLNVNQENFDNQREVVKEERRWRVDNRPYGTQWEETFKRLFKVHPYRWPVIGYMEHLNAATVEDAKKFFDTYYVPNNAVLVIAGDIDVEKTKKLIEKYFGDIPRGKHEIKRPNVVEPPLTQQVRDTIYDNIRLPAVFISFKIPKDGEKDYYALDLLANILGSGRSSRLYQKLVYEKRIAQNVNVFAIGMEDAGVFKIDAYCAIGHTPEEVEKEIWNEIEKIRTELVAEKELQKAKNQTEAQIISGYQTVLQKADQLARYYVIHKNTNKINTELDEILSITREDIREAANKYLKPDKSVVLYYLPREQRASK
ncbi:MAG: pitrilysin family protein [Candidatus Kryptonium sp.]|nr:insulinase family protein [Candidatus Kryptonium sp.]MCX7761516.1 insulinase family protein [Candidatus Kryptonium sp.]MDW8109496.1 pitrilysin family protein [Candidatus Kryptonium sp.]